MSAISNLKSFLIAVQLFILAESVSAQDTCFERNRFSIELIGNNYISRFNDAFSPVSINYRRSFKIHNIELKTSLGVGLINYSWDEYVFHRDWPRQRVVSTLPIGLLAARSVKRGQVNAGLFYCAAFGRQTYYVWDQNHVSTRRDVNYDFTLIPYLSYEFWGKGERISWEFSIAPKLNQSNRVGNYANSALPWWFVFGISCGYRW